MTDTPGAAPRRIGGIDDDLDPDLAPAGRDEQPPSQLESLEQALSAALTADVTYDPITLAIEKRPGVTVRYGTQISDEQIAAWRKRRTNS